MKTMRIKNWAKFQHFKDRKPPWVKLYRDLLDDKEWHRLDSKAAKTLIMLWLVASENNGDLPDRETLAFRLRTTETEVSSTISKLSHWLEQSDITVISRGYQDDGLETETETEEETEYETSNEVSSPQPSLPDCPHAEILKLWGKHFPHLTQPRVWEGNRRNLLKARWIQASRKSDYSPDGYETVETGLRWWDDFFGYIIRETKLGNGFDSPGRSWRPDLPWICKAENFAKIVEGKYDL